MDRRLLIPSVLFICVFLPNRAWAQGAPMIPVVPPVPAPLPESVAQPDPASLNPPSPTSTYSGMGPYGSPNVHHYRFPTPPPTWAYGTLPGNYITTDYPRVGFPGYRPPFANFRPQIPVYTPLPMVYGGPDSSNHLAQRRSLGGFGGLGLGYYGWFGPYRASPRPFPPSVNPWPIPIETLAPVVQEPPPLAERSCLYLSLKVPQPTAEIIVGGIKTLQTGTDRLYESPPLEAGKEYAYEITARWVEGGATIERKKRAVGKPGEVIRLDLSAP
ncbi:MAG TPA: TIGR03000 domain-containing protein [Gemmataceae bacterium]|jgi:uncharacterized protein (TIGR03000 family)